MSTGTPASDTPTVDTGVTTLADDTVDLVLWRHLGRTAGLIEPALECNPGIAARGPVLPAGIAVVLPATPAAAARVRETVKLWS